MNEQQAREAIIQYRDATGKSQSEIAKELGISSGQLSAFIGGTYKAPHTVIPKIGALLEKNESRKLAPEAPAFAETTVSRQVMDVIEYCHLQGKLGVVYGDAGIGKTMGILRYCEQNPMALHITASPVFATMSGMNDLLCEKTGIRERNARRIYQELVNRLRGSGRVIIIDEAQHLTKKTLEHLRSISDETGVGICFVGNEEVYSRLKGTGKADFAQIFSRIAIRRPVLLGSIRKVDVEKIFFGKDLDENSMDFLYKIAKTRYGIRGAVNVYVAAAALFGKVDSAAIVRVAREMNIG